MYSLTPGYRIPALQRGLSNAEMMLTKSTAGVGSALLASAMVSPPPPWAFGAVFGAAALINLAPGPRSVGRWAAVGYRHFREQTAPASMTAAPGETRTWVLYPEHGTMQDPLRRAMFHDAFSRALTFAAGQARTDGIQVHVSHHALPDGEYTDHAQTISVFVPKGLVGSPERTLDTLEDEFDGLGVLVPLDWDPMPNVVERGPGWVGLDDGRYASTARITAWPDETQGDLMAKLLLGPARDQRQRPERSLAVLYRPLTEAQSRRDRKWRDAASGAFTTDAVQQEQNNLASEARHGALVHGATLVDLDAYVTVWGDTPEAVTAARSEMDLTANRFRIALDWLSGQQHRAHVMTTPHAAATQKGAIL